jgi:hypothetical protein
VLFVPGYEDSDLTRTRRPTARDAGRLSPRGSLRRFRENARAPRACATTVSRRERHPRRHARSLLEVPTARRNGLEVPLAAVNCQFQARLREKSHWWRVWRRRVPRDTAAADVIHNDCDYLISYYVL